MACILVVDDEDQLRAFIRIVLEQAGHLVLLAQNGKEALQIARQISIDLIITDIVLPDFDGLELLGELKPKQSNMKVVAMSGKGQQLRLDVLKIAQKLGAIHTLEKPFTVTILLQTIQDILNSEEATHSNF